MKVKTIVVLFLLLSSQSKAIIGGITLDGNNKVRESVVGIMVHYLDKYWFTNATGSVIGDRYILTAAHVVFDKVPYDTFPGHFIVNFSNEQISPKPNMIPSDESTLSSFVTRKVVAIKIHPLFKNEVGKHDLAILKLDEPIPIGMRPVRFLNSEYLKILGNDKNSFVLIGTGVINEQFEHNSKINMANVDGYFIDNSIVTNQKNGSGACSGDSGGPAFVLFSGVYYQVGVISGPNKGSKSCHEEGLLSNVSVDLDFIENSIKELNGLNN